MNISKDATLMLHQQTDEFLVAFRWNDTVLGMNNRLGLFPLLGLLDVVF